MALFIVVTKAAITFVSVAPFRLGPRTTAFAALGMIQIGEFSYVLAQAGRAAGTVSEELNSVILTSSVVTITLTPAAFWLAPRAAAVLGRVPLLGERPGAPQTEATEGLAGHAVVVGYGRVGSHVAAGLRTAGFPVAVVEEDLHLVQQLRAEGVPAVFGDASQPNVLRAAHPERARLVVVALPDSGTTLAVVRAARAANPAAPILARAARSDDDETLRRAGATGVIAPEEAGAVLLLEECRQVAEASAFAR
jgi:CPA2 family monovalent cation:H+ antiporter-2